MAARCGGATWPGHGVAVLADDSVLEIGESTHRADQDLICWLQDSHGIDGGAAAAHEGLRVGL